MAIEKTLFSDYPDVVEFRVELRVMRLAVNGLCLDLYSILYFILSFEDYVVTVSCAKTQ